MNLIKASHAYDPRVSHQDREKWCDFCVKWTDHKWRECKTKARYLRERAFQASQIQSNGVHQSVSEERPRQSLGSESLRQNETSMSCKENENEFGLDSILSCKR